MHMCLLQKICRITVSRKDHLNINHNHYHLKITIVGILFIFIPIFPIHWIILYNIWGKLTKINFSLSDFSLKWSGDHWSKLHSLYIIPKDILVFILFHKEIFKKSNQGKGNQDQRLSSKFNLSMWNKTIRKNVFIDLKIGIRRKNNRKSKEI